MQHGHNKDTIAADFTVDYDLLWGRSWCKHHHLASWHSHV